MSEEQIIDVGIADKKIAKAPVKLITRGLGSCVGVTIYDPGKKIGGMAHAMLPDIDRVTAQVSPLRFVNYLIKSMVEELENCGCFRKHLEAKLFGGAHMFGFLSSESVLNVGDKNVEKARAVLKEMGINIAVDDTGGTFGRTITLNLENGKVLIKTISWGEREV